MKTSKRNRWLSFLLALIMLVGLLPLSVLSAGAESGGEETTGANRGAARASSRVYPTLTNLIEGTEIRSGYQYSFYKNGKVYEHFLYSNIDPEEYRYNSGKCRNYKSDTDLQRVVTYTDGVLMYWTRFENDFLDLSGLEGRSLTLILFDNLKLSALYAPGVDLRLMVTDGVYVTFNHSTRYKNKTAYGNFGYGESKDGALLLISIEDNDWYISTCGYGITVFTDAGIEYIGKQIKGDLSDGNFAGAFDKFADLCDDFITQARTGEPYDVKNLPKEPLSLIWIPIAIVVGFVLSLIIVGNMKAKLKTVRFQAAASNYIKDNSLNINERRDLFLYNTVTRTAKPKNDDSGGGSSTHTSSSGTTHGGGGGKF